MVGNVIINNGLTIIPYNDMAGFVNREKKAINICTMQNKVGRMGFV
jgi:hypothetical protein